MWSTVQNITAHRLIRAVFAVAMSVTPLPDSQTSLAVVAALLSFRAAAVALIAAVGAVSDAITAEGVRETGVVSDTGEGPGSTGAALLVGAVLAVPMSVAALDFGNAVGSAIELSGETDAVGRLVALVRALRSTTAVHHRPRKTSPFVAPQLTRRTLAVVLVRGVVAVSLPIAPNFRRLAAPVRLTPEISILKSGRVVSLQSLESSVSIHRTVPGTDSHPRLPHHRSRLCSCTRSLTPRTAPFRCTYGIPSDTLQTQQSLLHAVLGTEMETLKYFFSMPSVFST